MTLDELALEIRRVSFRMRGSGQPGVDQRSPAEHIRFSVIHAGARLAHEPRHAYLVIYLETRTVNVQTGGNSWVTRSEVVSEERARAMSPSCVPALVREVWRKLWDHEFDEWATLDGRTIREPHQ